ncbi:MAG: hypothetical protein R3A44_44220 [Caldilineaceae bacterium]
MARRNHLTARQDEEIALASDSNTDALAAIPLVYDYSQIAAEHRAQVQEDAAYIKAGMHRTSKEMLEWGARLARIKERTDHGQFGAILETELGFTSPRLPQMWMAAAARLGDKSENFAHLPASALYLLGAESTPAEAVEQIEQRIDAGEQLGLNDVRAVVDELKRPAAYVLTLDETIKVIWGAIKYKQTLQERLREAKALNYAARYKPYLGNGQELDSDTFHTAWSTVVSELEGQIEHPRKQHEQAQRYQQRTLEDAAADEDPAGAIINKPTARPETIAKALMTYAEQGDLLGAYSAEQWVQWLTNVLNRKRVQEILPTHRIEEWAWRDARSTFCLTVVTSCLPEHLRQQGWKAYWDFHHDAWRKVHNNLTYGVFTGRWQALIADIEAEESRLASFDDNEAPPAPAPNGEPDIDDHRAERIAAIKIAFVQCLATFKEYSELTGDFASPTVPKLGIQAMLKKLVNLEAILAEEESASNPSNY